MSRSMDRFSDVRSISAMWSRYEVMEWKDDQGRDIQLWKPVATPEEFAYFVESAMDWINRALSPHLPAIYRELSENPGAMRKDPKTHVPNLSWRGQACASWHLASSAQRIVNHEFYALDTTGMESKELAAKWRQTRDELNEAENELLDRARSEYGKADLSDIEILAWAQHESAKHSDRAQLATRLLDVTSDPLVALYFATEDCLVHPDQQCEGRVIAFDEIVPIEITGGEDRHEIRSSIGAIWRPENQTLFQAAQKGSFIIMGILPDHYEDILEVLDEFEPDEDRPQHVVIGNREFPIFAWPEDLVAEHAHGLQQISVQGIGSAFAEGLLAFHKKGESNPPSTIAQSIRISHSSKKVLREYLRSKGITEERLFPQELER